MLDSVVIVVLLTKSSMFCKYIGSKTTEEKLFSLVKLAFWVGCHQTP